MDKTDTAFASAAEQVRMLATGQLTSPRWSSCTSIASPASTVRSTPTARFRTDAARTEALEAQRRLESGERLPLLGVPIAVKDDLDVAGEVTAWGDRSTRVAKERDSEVVRRLRDAGAIILGKTNVPEMTI